MEYPWWNFGVPCGFCRLVGAVFSWYVLIETYTLVLGSRAEEGVASKLGDETRLMTMKGGTVLEFRKNACMHVWGL